MSTSHTRPPHTLTARCPEDLLAVANVVLGFEPADSLVMLTVGRHQFHARVDLARDDVETVVACLAEPAVHHRVESTVLLAYTADDRLARRVVGRLRRRLERAGVGVLDAMRVDDGRWHPLLRSRDGLGATGVPYDVSSHPFVVAAVLDGRVIHGSRNELAATLDPVAELVAEVEASRPAAPADAAWVRSWASVRGTAPSPSDAARLLEAITDPTLRDAAWSEVARSHAREHAAVWSDLVRRAPDDLVAHAASVLAFLAWLAGDGALAWCAVDRARTADPEHTLATLVADLLLGAVPPSEWERVAARPSA